MSEEDLPSYMRAGGRSNNYKQQAIDNGKKIILTTPDEVKTYIEKAISGEKGLPTVAYGKVDVRLSEETADYSNDKIQIDNFYLELVANDIHHAYQEHLHAKEKGDIDLSIEDFKNIPHYVATYDDFVYAIKYKSGITKICLIKRISDGRVLIIETVSKSHGSIEFKNLIGVSEEKYIEEYEKRHKKRNSTNTRGNESSNNSLRDETASSNTIIPDSSEKSNSSAKKRLEKSEKTEKSGESEVRRKIRKIVEGRLDGRYYSESLRGREREVIERLKREGTRVYSGELSEKGKRNLTKAKLLIEGLTREGVIKPDFVISEEMKSDYAYLDGKMIVLGKDTLEDGSYVKKILHEICHFAEGSKEYRRLASFLFKHTDISEAKETVIANYGSLGVTEEVAESAEKAMRENSEEISEAEMLYISEVVAHKVEELLSNSQTIVNLTKRYKSVGEKVLDRIKKFLKVFKAKTPTERNAIQILQKAEKLYSEALEKMGTQYIVNKSLDRVQHSFAGTNARTANIERLEDAQVLLYEGADPEEVRKQTGWFRGYEGMWRFEIDDFDSSLIENPKLQKHTDDGETYFTGKMTDIFNHTALFSAYPELKDINIVIQKTDFGTDAIYQPNSNYITISKEHFKRQTKAYLEYVNGGKKVELEKIEASDLYRKYNHLYDDDVMENMEPTEWLEAEKNARVAFYTSDIGKRYYELKWGKNGFEGERFELGWSKEAKAVLLHEIQHAGQNIEGFAKGTNTRDKNYDLNAGEIEARDVSNRIDFTDKQRKNTRPDIDRTDVVFAERSSVSFFAKNRNNEETDSVKLQLRNHLAEVNEMEPVVDVKYHVVNKPAKKSQ